MTMVTTSGRASTRQALLTVVTLVVVVAAAALLMSRNVGVRASPTSTLERYVTAVQTGDRRGLEQVIPESSPQRVALLHRHGGHPAVISSVTMEATVSSAWWTLTVTYDQLSQPMPTEHLMIEPRPGLTPDDAPEWVVS